MNDNARTRNIRRAMHDDAYNYVVRPASRIYRDPKWELTGHAIIVAFCCAMAFIVLRFGYFAFTGK